MVLNSGHFQIAKQLNGEGGASTSRRVTKLGNFEVKMRTMSDDFGTINMLILAHSRQYALIITADNMLILAHGRHSRKHSLSTFRFVASDSLMPRASPLVT